MPSPSCRAPAASRTHDKRRDSQAPVAAAAGHRRKRGRGRGRQGPIAPLADGKGWESRNLARPALPHGLGRRLLLLRGAEPGRLRFPKRQRQRIDHTSSASGPRPLRERRRRCPSRGDSGGGAFVLGTEGAGSRSRGRQGKQLRYVNSTTGCRRFHPAAASGAVRGGAAGQRPSRPRPLGVLGDSLGPGME